MMMRDVVVWVAMVMTGGSFAVAQDKVDFAAQIQPIFAEHCIKCHGEKQASGRMRLHTATGLKEKWDADQELLVAGEPEKSELYQRITLPADDKKRMPKMADPLPKEKIELIAKWIREGAVLPGAAVPTATVETDDAAAVDDAPAELPLPEAEPAPQEAIDKLAAAGAQVMPLFAESPLLQVSFAHRGEPAGDAQIALLANAAEQVYALNLSDSKPSDEGLAPLAQLKNLAALHLERSAVTDAGLAHIAALSSLQYLNLYGTEITDDGLKHLAGLKHLRRLYLWQTKVSYEAAMSMEKDIPGLIVNLGYDHPMVVKMRLTKELEQVKKHAEEAQAEQTKAEQQLEAAKKSAEAANARLAELEKQLKELEQPAGEDAAPSKEEEKKEAEASEKKEDTDGEDEKKPEADAGEKE